MATICLLLSVATVHEQKDGLVNTLLTVAGI